MIQSTTWGAHNGGHTDCWVSGPFLTHFILTNYIKGADKEIERCELYQRQWYQMNYNFTDIVKYASLILIARSF